MAATGIFVCSSVFLLLIGITLSRSEKCNDDNYRKCFRVEDALGACRRNALILACLQKLTQPCIDDELTRILTTDLETLAAKGEQCPGLPNGECFHTVVMDCESKIPTYHRIRIKDSEKGRKSYCPSVKSNLPDAKDCFKDLKTKCSSQHALKAIDVTLSEFKTLEKMCDKS